MSLLVQISIYPSLLFCLDGREARLIAVSGLMLAKSISVFQMANTIWVMQAFQTAFLVWFLIEQCAITSESGLKAINGASQYLYHNYST
jgi:hypothetical protein